MTHLSKQPPSRYIEILEQEDAAVKKQTNNPAAAAQLFLLAAGATDTRKGLVNTKEESRLRACLKRLDAWLLRYAPKPTSDIQLLESFLGKDGKTQVRCEELTPEAQVLAVRLLDNKEVVCTRDANGKAPELSATAVTRWWLARRHLNLQ